MMVRVTKWKYLNRRPALILQGSTEETREEAAQYFDQPKLLTAVEGEMEEEELYVLPEFES